MIPDAAVRRAFRLIRDGSVASLGQRVLTTKEREALTLFARGKSYDEIGEARSGSMVTVQNAIHWIQDNRGLGRIRISWSGL